MPGMKLSKRTYLTVVQSDERAFSSPGYCGAGPIYSFHQWYALRRKHKKGSSRPEGWFHSPYGNIRVEIRWLWTEECNYFAPELSFRPNMLANKIVVKIAEALQDIGSTDDAPDALIEKLQATIVRYVDDNGECGECFDDYRPLRPARVKGEPAMSTIARYAS